MYEKLHVDDISLLLEMLDPFDRIKQKPQPRKKFMQYINQDTFILLLLMFFFFFWGGGVGRGYLLIWVALNYFL